MPGTNVELSKNELALVSSSEFILTKNRIIEKVYNLFGSLSENYKSILEASDLKLPGEVLKTHPKIYKGENYLQLPYVMMDYPRTFLKDDVFAIRSFFWWGNYFSITLQLSGKYFQLYKDVIHHNLKNLIQEDYFIGVNDDVWQHHFEPNNYKALNKINIDEAFQKPFIKIAAKFSLNEWNDVAGFYKEKYGNLINLLSKN